MKLFVSAVTKGLGSYREAVAAYLSQRGIEYVEQRNFGIRSQQLHHLLTDLIRGCDGVICLIGPNFGFAPADDPSRSYTQYEYFVANELRKDVYLFCAADGLPLDPLKPGQVADTPEQLEWQQQFRRWIQQHDRRIRYEFRSVDELLRLTSDSVFDSEKSGPSASPQVQAAIERSYPTPIVEMYDRVGGDVRQLYLLCEDLLRFTALLAAHTLMHAGDSGGVCGDAAVSTVLRDDVPGRHSAWRVLLDAACAANREHGDASLMPELADWNATCHEQIDELLVDCDAVRKREFHERRLEAERSRLSQCATRLIESLSFLKHYLLLEVPAGTGAGDTVNCELFRGRHSQQVPLSPRSSAGLFLLDLDRRRSFALAPILLAEARVQHRGIYGWSCLEGSPSAGQLVLAPFGDVDPSEIVRDLRFENGRVELAPCANRTQESAIPWPECWRRFVTAHFDAGAMCAAGCPEETQLQLSDDDWRSLEVLAFPERDPRQFLGGRFHVLPPPLHTGKCADIIPAVDRGKAESSESDAVTEPILVHRLREECSDDQDVHNWFMHRMDHWQRLEHPAILRIEDGSSFAASAKHPFIVVRQVQGIDLESRLQAGRPLSDRDALRIVRLAAEVCRDAHAKGLRLLALPLRHFLWDEADNIWMTGFETAVAADVVAGRPAGWLERHVRCFSREGELLAPEADRQRQQLPVTVDVFAIGMLAARLKGMARRPQEWLPLDAWADPWQCFVFHCLAAQPAMRFQSAHQLLTVLDQQVMSGHDVFPRLVNAGGAAEPRLRFGQYPITNREYHAYCRDRDESLLPWYLHQLDRDESQHNRRLAGPWLPVAYVNLHEAQAYCAWLSSTLKIVARIPNENEWLQAAGPGRYPWGDSLPDADRANFDRHFRGSTVVGGFEAGVARSGCADLAGNVWEWCTDRVFEGTPRRVLKGGAHDFPADSLCNAAQWPVLVMHRSQHVGFRIVVEG